MQLLLLLVFDVQRNGSPSFVPLTCDFAVKGYDSSRIVPFTPRYRMQTERFLSICLILSLYLASLFN
jgi:hypothetical protein